MYRMLLDLITSISGVVDPLSTWMMPCFPQSKGPLLGVPRTNDAQPSENVELRSTVVLIRTIAAMHMVFYSGVVESEPTNDLPATVGDGEIRGSFHKLLGFSGTILAAWRITGPLPLINDVPCLHGKCRPHKPRKGPHARTAPIDQQHKPRKKPPHKDRTKTASLMDGICL
jgi:hypothetical protein